MSYTDPFVPELDARRPHAVVGRSGRRRSTQAPDCAVICTDHAVFDYDALVDSGTLIVDTRNALKNHTSPRIFRL